MKMRSKYCGSMPMPLSCTASTNSFSFQKNKYEPQALPCTELDRVADEVLQQLRQLRLVALHLGQRIVRQRDAALLQRGAQIGARALECASRRSGLNSLPRVPTLE